MDNDELGHKSISDATNHKFVVENTEELKFSKILLFMKFFYLPFTF